MSEKEGEVERVRERERGVSERRGRRSERRGESYSLF